MLRDIHFHGVSAPLRLDGADAVLPLLGEVAAGWPIRLDEADPAATPFFSIRSVPGEARLRCASHVEDRPPQLWDPLNSVCDAMASLAVALPLSDPHLISLHAAGVEMAGRLVVFPNIRRAGKSTLSVALARAGHRVFSDDVVPLSFPSNGRAIAHAMGLAPRLRLPLPDSLPAGFRAWAEAVPGPRNRQYHYLPLFGQPAHGAQLPVGAFVLLDRRDVSTRACLNPVPPDAAMDALLHQNFTRDRHSGEVLEVIAATLAATQVWQLTYADLEEAVGCLEANFAKWPDPELALPDGPVRVLRKFEPFQGGPGTLATGLPLMQRHGTVARMIGAGLYLADDQGRAIQRMDPLAAVIWSVLEEPTAPAEIEALLVEAFPDVGRDRIAADLCRLLKDFDQAGLIEKSSEDFAPESAAV